MAACFLVFVFQGNHNTVPVIWMGLINTAPSKNKVRKRASLWYNVMGKSDSTLSQMSVYGRVLIRTPQRASLGNAGNEGQKGRRGDARILSGVGLPKAEPGMGIAV